MDLKNPGHFMDFKNPGHFMDLKNPEILASAFTYLGICFYKVGHFMDISRSFHGL